MYIKEALSKVTISPDLNPQSNDRVKIKITSSCTTENLTTLAISMPAHCTAIGTNTDGTTLNPKIVKNQTILAFVVNIKHAAFSRLDIDAPNSWKISFFKSECPIDESEIYLIVGKENKDVSTSKETLPWLLNEIQAIEISSDNLWINGTLQRAVSNKKPSTQNSPNNNGFFKTRGSINASKETDRLIEREDPSYRSCCTII